MDIDSYWEYADPEKSEQRFHALMQSASKDERLELQTQIARTYGLRKNFAEAHAILDEVEAQFPSAGSKPRIRFLLERGRVFNSSGEKQKARPLFEAAFDHARNAGEEGLAVDAAHMIAITWIGMPQALEWNMRAIEMARGSKDAKAASLMPALLNNTAWDLFDAGKFDEALVLFFEAQDAWTRHNKKPQIQTARWSVARCLRALNRNTEAMTILNSLEKEHQEDGTVDGFVFEEQAENLAAVGETEKARSYFSKAVTELSKDEWFVKNEAARFASLQERSRNPNP